MLSNCKTTRHLSCTLQTSVPLTTIVNTILHIRTQFEGYYYSRLRKLKPILFPYSRTKLLAEFIFVLFLFTLERKTQKMNNARSLVLRYRKRTVSCAFFSNNYMLHVTDRNNYK